MKGLLEHPPTEDETERLYHELARIGAPSVGRPAEWPYRIESKEHLLALAGEMLRHDPAFAQERFTVQYPFRI